MGIRRAPGMRAIAVIAGRGRVGGGRDAPEPRPPGACARGRHRRARRSPTSRAKSVGTRREECRPGARSPPRSAAHRFIEHENLHFDGFTAFCRSRSRLQRPLRGLGGALAQLPHARRDVRRGHREVRQSRGDERHAGTQRVRRVRGGRFRFRSGGRRRRLPRRLRVSRFAFRVVRELTNLRERLPPRIGI